MIAVGTKDHHLHGGSLSVYDPWSDAGTCSRALSPEETGRLLAAASSVDWESFVASYRPATNPTCCCDQFIYSFSAQIELCEGGAPQSHTTSWCDESISSGLLPQPLDDLLDVLTQIGGQVEADC